MSAVESTAARSKGYDVSDWLQEHSSEDLRSLIDDTPIWDPSLYGTTDTGTSSMLPTFPVEIFPPALQAYVVAGAEALGVPIDMIAVPMLGFAAGAIGNTRALRVKPGWVVRAILWLAVIGAPGSGKSPSLDHARHPLDALQQMAWESFRSESARWDEAAAAAKTEKPTGQVPEKPVLAHYFTTDATMEALAVLLGESPGLAMVRDELVGWVRSHDAYRKAGDRQNWLSLWAGSPLKVDRRGTGTLYVPRPTVSVVGGIQPDLLPDLAPEAGQADGFVDRLLMVWPQAHAGRWSDAVVGPEVAKRANHLFRLLRVPTADDEPSVAELSLPARRAFAAWFDENAELVSQAKGLAAGCYAKYPGQCARVALVLHCLSHPRDLSRPVDEGTVEDAITVMEYFRQHLARVLPAFGAAGVAKGAGLVARVARLLAREGGAWVSRTAINDGLGGHAGASEFTTALEALALNRRAESRSAPTGKRPREEWRWCGADIRKYPDISQLESGEGDNSVQLRNSASISDIEEMEW